jgi:hypothetical protein
LSPRERLIVSRFVRRTRRDRGGKRGVVDLGLINVLALPRSGRMTPTLLALAMLAQPDVRVGRTEARRIASVILTVASEHELDPSLLAAIVIAESGGRNIVAYRRGRGRRGADVGVFQIHCPRARPSCVGRYRGLEASAREAARQLTRGRRRCEDPTRSSSRMCREGFWTCYNAGSRIWPGRVRRLWDRIKRHVAEAQAPYKLSRAPLFPSS